MLTQEQKQETVNRVVAFMSEQRLPAHDGEACAYWDHDDRQCAIGCLMTEEQCIEADDKCWTPRDIATKKGWNGWTEEDSDFLMALQGCHDDAAPSNARADSDPFLPEFDIRISRFCEDWKLVHPGGLC